MVRFGRTDANQSAVVSWLRDIPGVSVHVLSDAGDGFPDLAIGYKGVNYLVELKDGAKKKSAQKLTDDQVEWHATWNGQKAVCNCLGAILELLEII